MHSMCALHHTNWSSRIIKVLGVKSGNTSFWMKHRILRTSSHRDGSCFSIFNHRGNVFNTEQLKGLIQSYCVNSNTTVQVIKVSNTALFLTEA
jgi:hypothetical protein